MTTSAFSLSPSTNENGTWTDFKHISASASRLGLIDFALGSHHTDDIVEFLDMDAEEALASGRSGHLYEVEPA